MVQTQLVVADAAQPSCGRRSLSAERHAEARVLVVWRVHALSEEGGECFHPGTRRLLRCRTYLQAVTQPRDGVS